MSLWKNNAGLSDAITACVTYTVPMYTIPFLEKFKVPGFKYAHSFPTDSYRFLLLLPERRSVLEEDVLGKEE